MSYVGVPPCSYSEMHVLVSLFHGAIERQRFSREFFQSFGVVIWFSSHVTFRLPLKTRISLFLYLCFSMCKIFVLSSPKDVWESFYLNRFVFVLPNYISRLYILGFQPLPLSFIWVSCWGSTEQNTERFHSFRSLLFKGILSSRYSKWEDDEVPYFNLK